jgi:hypothetical protein
MNSPSAKASPDRSRKPWRGISAAAKRIRKHSLADISLVGCGLLTAFTSASFASYMLIQEAHGPFVRDMQYLALFARPRRSSGSATDRVPDGNPGLASLSKETPIDSEVDMMPTGSISRASPAPSPTNLLRIVGGRPDVVYLSNGDAIRAVRVGDVIPGIGRVGAIAKREGGWTLLSDQGTPLFKNEFNTINQNIRGDTRFSRSLIFDAPARN